MTSMGPGFGPEFPTVTNGGLSPYAGLPATQTGAAGLPNSQTDPSLPGYVFSGAQTSPLLSQTGGQLPPADQRPVDPGVFGLPGHVASGGLPVPIPSTTDQAPHLQAPIEHVIANLGIHPQSGLAQAFRAIHGVLMAHMAAQAARVAHASHGAHPPLGMGRPGGPIHPGPVLQ